MDKFIGLIVKAAKWTLEHAKSMLYMTVWIEGIPRVVYIVTKTLYSGKGGSIFTHTSRLIFKVPNKNFQSNRNTHSGIFM